MKNKIVIWAKDEKDQKQLLAIQLNEKENQIEIYKFPESIVTEDFYKQLMNQWKNDEEVPFVEGYETITRPLSMTEDLLPENLLVDRPDIITRAKAEWHFVVLSSKLYELYHSELADISEKVDRLEAYSAPIWEEMKGFWSKVQTQVREKNLFREHANELRNSTNALFDKLKSMRKDMDNKFREESKKHVASFSEAVDTIKEKIQSGKSLQPLFEELKKIQSSFSSTKFSKEDRSKVWNKIDSAFKELKEKKYGKAGAQGSNNALTRLENRYQGLLQAIGRMKNSIDRDLRDKNNQSNQAERAGGQLEAQLRQARIMMIDERITSKQAKMKDMLKTKEELERKIAKEKERAAKRKEQADLKAKTEEKKEEIKAKIANESQMNVNEEESAKLAAAAAAIKEGKQQVKSTKKEVPLITSTEVNVQDVAADKLKDEVSEDSSSSAPQEESLSDKVEDVVEDVADIVEDVVDNIKAVASTAMDTLGSIVDKLSGEEE